MLRKPDYERGPVRMWCDDALFVLPQPWDESAAWSAASAARSAAWEKIAAKSIEIFRAAPVPAERMAIESCVRQELCAKRLWCPEKELVGV